MAWARSTSFQRGLPPPQIRCQPNLQQSRPQDPPTCGDDGGTPTSRRRARLQGQLRFGGPVRDVVHPCRDDRQGAQVQDVLTRGQALTRRGQQQRELGIGMRRPDVLNLLDLPAPAHFSTICTAVAPEAVRTLRTNRETPPKASTTRFLVTTS